MTIFSGAQDRPEAPAGRPASSELIKRIRKLRWIGMDDEARQLEHSLRGVLPADAVLFSDPRETD